MMIEKGGKVYLKRTAPNKEPSSREGLSSSGDGWMHEEEGNCCLCGNPYKGYVNKCKECLDKEDKGLRY